MAEQIKSPADILAACSAVFENAMSLYARRTEAMTELWGPLRTSPSRRTWWLCNRHTGRGRSTIMGAG